MASRSLGTLTVDVIAKVGGFTKGMTEAERKADKSARAIEARMRKLGAGIDAGLRIAGAAAVASATALAAVVKSAIDSADEMSKAAQKIGTTTESLSKLSYAAQLADVDLGALQSGLARLTKFQAEAAGGAEKSVAVFEALGIAFKNSDGTLRNTTEVFREFSEVFQDLPDGANKTALALQVFGRSGASLIPLLNGGAEGLDSMADRAERLGIVIDTQTGLAAEEFNDRLQDLSLQARGLGLALAEELLPDLNKLVGELQAGSASGDGFASTAENIANGIRGVVFVADKGFQAIRGLVLALADLSVGALQLVTSFGTGALLASDEDDAKIADLRAVLQAGAKDAEQRFLGTSPAASPSAGQSQGIRGGRGRGAGSSTPEADAAAAAALAQLKHNESLEKLRAIYGSVTPATEASTAARRADTSAVREQAEQLDAAAEARERSETLAQQMLDDKLEAQAEAKRMVDQTLADIAFETKLLGMNAEAREEEIALRYANAKAATAEGDQIIAALREYEEAAKEAEGVDFARDATKGLFEDLADGVGSAQDAVDGFFDNLRAKALQVLADKLFDGLFDGFKTSATSGGGGIAGFLGSLFGGARAGGGPVYPGKAYLVGEEGPELIRPMGAGVVSNARDTARMGGGGGTTNVTFVLPGRNDLRTESQRQADLGRATQRQLSRGTA